MTTFTLNPPVREGEYKIKQGWQLRAQTDYAIVLEAEHASTIHTEGGEQLVYTVVTFEIDDDYNVIRCHAVVMVGEEPREVGALDRVKMFNECFEEANK